MVAVIAYLQYRPFYRDRLVDFMVAVTAYLQHTPICSDCYIYSPQPFTVTLLSAVLAKASSTI